MILKVLTALRHTDCYPGFPDCEARSVKSVEEDVAHNISCLCPGHPQAGAEPLIAGAVHEGADPPVHQAVLALSWVNAVRTPQVMMPATPAKQLLHQQVMPPTHPPTCLPHYTLP